MEQVTINVENTRIALLSGKKFIKPFLREEYVAMVDDAIEKSVELLSTYELNTLLIVVTLLRSVSQEKDFKKVFQSIWALNPDITEHQIEQAITMVAEYHSKGKELKAYWDKTAEMKVLTLLSTENFLGIRKSYPHSLRKVPWFIFGNGPASVASGQ